MRKTAKAFRNHHNSLEKLSLKCVSVCKMSVKKREPEAGREDKV